MNRRDGEAGDDPCSTEPEAEHDDRKIGSFVPLRFEASPRALFLVFSNPYPSHKDSSSWSFVPSRMDSDFPQIDEARKDSMHPPYPRSAKGENTIANPV